MKNLLLMATAGVFFAALAWAFWHYSGTNGYGILSTIALVAATADNIRLRKIIKDKEKATSLK